jgi:uncharacterized protein (TIGR02246 family)
MNETMKSTIDRFFEAVNAHDADAVADLVAEDVVFWEPSHQEPRIGREAMREEMRGFFAMLPDIRFEAEKVMVDDNVIMCEYGYEATYEGKPVRLRECSVTHLDEAGLFSEVRVYFDRLTLLRQLGLAGE